MYIDPFIAGVLSTILFEVILIIGVAITNYKGGC